MAMPRRDRLLLNEIQWACDENKILRLLKNGANPNRPDEEGKTAFFHLIEKLAHNGLDSSDLPKKLVEFDAEIRAADKRQKTGLHLAALHGLPNLVKFFLDQKAEVNARDTDGNTPLMFTVAACGGPPVKAMFHDWRDYNHHGTTNRCLVIETLARAGANIDLFNKLGTSALIIASENNGLFEIEALAKAKADINIRHQQSGNAPLHISARNHGINETMSALTILLEAKADPNIKNSSGESPLHIAAKTAYRGDAIYRLVHAGAGIDAQSSDGNTPLHLAARENNVENIQTLLYLHANQHIQNRDGKKPAQLVRYSSFRTQREYLRYENSAKLLSGG